MLYYNLNDTANLWKNHFSAIANSVGSSDNQDQVINAVRTVPAHNDVINVHELRLIVKGLKNNKTVGNDAWIPSEVYKFASERLLIIISIFLYGCMLTGKLPNSLYARSDHAATEMQIERSSRCQQLQANCNCHSSLQGT